MLTCQRRSWNPKSWEFSKGGITQSDADPRSGASREFVEETGIVNDLVLAPLPGYGRRADHWFLAGIRDAGDLQHIPIVDPDTVSAAVVSIDDAIYDIRHDHKSILKRLLKEIRAGVVEWPPSDEHAYPTNLPPQYSMRKCACCEKEKGTDNSRWIGCGHFYCPHRGRRSCPDCIWGRVSDLPICKCCWDIIQSQGYFQMLVKLQILRPLLSLLSA